MSFMPCQFLIVELNKCDREELVAFFEPTRSVCVFHQQLRCATTDRDVTAPPQAILMEG